VSDINETHFLNVDLDIYSKSNREPLVAAMGRKVDAPFVGRVTGYPGNADSTIRHFCALIRALPKPARTLWDEAKVREFSIGIHARLKPNTFEITLDERTVKAASEVGAPFNVTIYSPASPTIKLRPGRLLSSTKERSC
jgi:hypothetical protein